MNQETDKKKLWQLNYYAENRERILQAAKERREKDPEAVKAYNKSYYQTHKERYQVNKTARKARAITKKTPQPLSKPPDARKLPKSYVTTKELPDVFGLPDDFEKRKRLLAVCHQGFFQKSVENPFHMTFE